MRSVFRKSVKVGREPRRFPDAVQSGPLSPRGLTPGLQQEMPPCLAQGGFPFCGLKDEPVRGQGMRLPEFPREILGSAEGATKAFGVRPEAKSGSERTALESNHPVYVHLPHIALMRRCVEMSRRGLWDKASAAHR